MRKPFNPNPDAMTLMENFKPNAEGLRSARRRRLILDSAGLAAAGLVGASLLSACDDNHDDNGNAGPTDAQTSAQSDADILNFALNLEYLESEFYLRATTGNGLPDNLIGGTGTPGAVTGGRMVAFTDPVVQQYANEITADETLHVAFLRNALGASAIARPAIDIQNSFNALFMAAGIITAGQTFDPYASDENFLLAAFVFEDVGVTAYKGSAALINSKTYLDAAAGILAIEAYHAGLLRTALYYKGVNTPSLRTMSEQISNARDSVDGATDDDQGVNTIGTGATAQSNIAPTDANGLAFGRSAAQVLNVTYLSKAQTSAGGFFPSGVNGNIRTSAAN